MTKGFSDYGRHLGMAFQLQDDVLDYLGDAEKLGKNIGDDLSEGKPTLPLIYAMREGDSASANTIRSAILEKDVSKIDDVVRAVKSSGGLEYTQVLAQSEADSAVAALSSVPDSAYKQALIDLTLFAIERNH